MVRKTSHLLKFEIIWVFVNTLTGDYKYPVPDSKEHPLPIEMQLC